MILVVTYGNGVRIGRATTVVLLRPILQVLPVDLTAWSVGVAGTTMPGSVARHTATSRLTTAAALGYAWFSPSNDFLFRVIHSYY